MNTAHARIAKDLAEVNSITNLDTPPVFARPINDNLEHVDALVIGPPDTPYALGFYRFDFKFPSCYPDKPPKVLITTTDNGRTRLNPNLYAGGKVCLSILGTWSGESADEWRSSYSANYVLRAIQSLIMTEKPYHNEPGYEEMNSEYSKPEEVVEYSEKIKHEVLRVAVCNAVDDAISGKKENPYKEIIKNYFLLWFEIYQSRAVEGLKRDGTEFPSMPFEYAENKAAGIYHYQTIINRLNDIKGKLEKETQTWKEKGHELTKAETGWKYFRLLEENDKIKKNSTSLGEGISAGPVTQDNLFYWNASLFGPENTLWEGGIYNLELVYDDSDAPPRVKFLTPMWHPHITTDGIPFYWVPPQTKEPVTPILNAIMKLLRSEPNASPATWVNVQAANQYFSKKEEEKKEYKKKVAQCVRRSVEG
eukprot:TRINITY_DN3954_c0_g1_i1.p1 TRINITY_DN3954_c0_g1~~TRINITY_DN3954_c0_g1_i1.p1  ORF type:complete len:421 (-),score=104.33 TRINITY_DN3954_c0_g1_i1:56-1318(-)